MFVFSAFIMGIVGNFHCLGMCGPIALALPLNRTNRATKFLSVLLYNLGRILVYTIFGVLVGLFGEGLQLGGMQQYLSILLGVTFILMVLFPIISKKVHWFNAPLFSRIGRLKLAFQNQMKKGSYKSLFVLGLLNGLLPCGLVYMALAGALTADTWYQGALFMALFGAGTLPIMFSLPFFAHLIQGSLKAKLKAIFPVVAILFGALLILRGANLGIPYVSPKISAEAGITQVKCH